ncbi:hypothetical protein BDK61_3796 [Haloarcula quadrata]|uniref:Uncharacterized protein n=1 Tax=Haloarcula quadrata TaxID=182779 RepID=A0A495QVQ2_9EURY|nr:hypothetical protein BDK61_3796 [Haloarcula quadrata]
MWPVVESLDHSSPLSQKWQIRTFGFVSVQTDGGPFTYIQYCQ